MPFYNLPLGQEAARSRVIADCYQLLGRPATIDLLDRMKELGFRESTRAGLSFATDDLRTPAEQGARSSRDAEKEVEQDRRSCTSAASSPSGERYNKVIDLWTHARDQITERDDGPTCENDVRDGEPYLNPIFLMADSGARGGVEQIRQLAGMRGLMAKPSGKIIETPIKANFREGLTRARVLQLARTAPARAWPTPPSRRPTPAT